MHDFKNIKKKLHSELAEIEHAFGAKEAISYDEVKWLKCVVEALKDINKLEYYAGMHKGEGMGDDPKPHKTY